MTTNAKEESMKYLPTHPNAGIEKQRKRFREFYVAGYDQAVKNLISDYKFIKDRVDIILKGMATYMVEHGVHKTPQDFYSDFCNDFEERVAALPTDNTPFLTPDNVEMIFNKVRELQAKHSATAGCYVEVAEWFNNLKEEEK